MLPVNIMPMLTTLEGVRRSFLMNATARSDCSTPLAAVEIICLIADSADVSLQFKESHGQ